MPEASETLVTEGIDITEILVNIESNTGLIADASVWVTGFLMFIVAVIVCIFVYKFFRIFF